MFMRLNSPSYFETIPTFPIVEWKLDRFVIGNLSREMRANNPGRWTVVMHLLPGLEKDWILELDEMAD